MAKKFNFLMIPTMPESKNFSEYSDDGEFDRSDDGNEEDSFYSKVNAESILLQILSTLNDKQKIVLLYQVVRELGYDLTHEECARTLSMGRVNYMMFLREVRKRAKKVALVPEQI